MDSGPAGLDTAGVAPARETPVRLQHAVIAHAAVLSGGAAWALGGNADWVGLACSLWGSLAIVTIVATVRATPNPAAAARQLSRFVWPFAVLNLLVLVSCLNPSYRRISADDVLLFVSDPALPVHAYWPSTARPDVSLRALWFFDAAYVTGLSVLVTIRRRYLLRSLLIALGVNAVVLAVFGTFQRLVNSDGPYFGAVRIQQPFFYATFLYHNHWGAYTLLMIAAVIAVTAHFARHARMRDLWHSPVPVGCVALLLLAASLPLSGSRSSTVLALLPIGFALFRYVPPLFAPDGGARSFSPAKVGIGVAVLFAASVFIFELARPMIEVRVSATASQWEQMRHRGEVLPRQILYRDTWQMAKDRLWLGWGMGSYPTVFYTRNTQHDSSDGPVRLFEDAHSDWLQSIAELGIVGTLVIALCALVPWYSLRGRIRKNRITTTLMLGCTTVLGYGLLEFPFGNRAVVITFWILWFVALRYAQLSWSVE